MKATKRRILALAMTLALALSLLPVSAIAKDSNELTMEVGETTTLNPTSWERGSWESSNGNVVTVNERGRVTAVGAGTATVTFTAERLQPMAAMALLEEPVVEEPTT